MTTVPVPDKQTASLAIRPDTRIVVAEDDPVSQKLIQLILGKLGFDVHIAGDGARAIELVRTLAPALVLMDMHMPEMDGPEAIRAIRADPLIARTPVVILSASVFDSRQSADLAALGVSDYLSKPIVRTQLLDVLARLLPGP